MIRSTRLRVEYRGYIGYQGDDGNFLIGLKCGQSITRRFRWSSGTGGWLLKPTAAG